MLLSIVRILRERSTREWLPMRRPLVC
jgi:hypothetical protein